MECVATEAQKTQWRLKYRQYIEHRTEVQRDKDLAIASARRKKYYRNRTQAQIEEEKIKRHLKYKEYMNHRTEEQKQRDQEYGRQVMKKCRSHRTEKQKEQIRQYKKLYYRKHIEQMRLAQRIDNPKLTEEQRQHRRNSKKAYDKKYKPIHRKKANEHYKLLRQEIIYHYSNETMRCAKCGFSDIRALTIDHINGGGCKHHKQIKQPIVYWIKHNNFPKDMFQVLCMNCQHLKRLESDGMQ